MGLRGIGAKPKSKKGDTSPKLRKRLPWHLKKLSRAERVIAFCEDLPITQGTLAGTKMRLRDWQRKFIEEVYAEDAKGKRPVRTAVLSLGRKNGKTQLAAALALCHLLGPESEPRGECYSLANDRAQASKVYSEMVAILNQHPELDARCNIIRFKKEIEVLEGPGAGSVYAALSAEAKTKHGFSPSFVVYDELGQAPGRDLYEAMDTAMGARDNPLMMVISTQAASDTAVLSELIDYGLRIHDGEIDDPSFHLTFYAAPADADPWNTLTWRMANPALDDFRSLEDVKRQAAQAQKVPSKENAFRNLILNQRIAAHVRFLSKSEWDANGGAVDVEALAGRTCFGALDLSATRDLTAFVLVFPADDDTFDILPQFFLPEEGIEEKSELDRVPYALWAKQGKLTLLPGKTIDPGFVAQAIADSAARFKIQTIAFDRWRIEDLRRELDAIGCEITLEPHGQGFRDFSPAVDRLENAVAEEKLRHGGHPVLTMCCSNTVVTSDPAGNRKLDKAKSSGRIDGIVALAMALNISSRFEPETEWIYKPGSLSV